jgi:hypothetical protein
MASIADLEKKNRGGGGGVPLASKTAIVGHSFGRSFGWQIIMEECSLVNVVAPYTPSISKYVPYYF